MLRFSSMAVIVLSVFALLTACSSGEDVALDTSAGFDVPETSGGDIRIGDPDTGGREIGVDIPLDFSGGEDVVSTPCETNEDCPTGVCVPTMNGKQCSIPCLEDCPAGWSCRPLPAGRDNTWVCVPDHITTCRPCAAHVDCQEAGFQPGGFCREFGVLEGAFCVTPCGVAIGCLDGFDCTTLDGGGTYCLPSDGTCECDPVAIDRQLATPCLLENDLGACPGERVCVVDGLTDCDAPTPVKEVCDGVDQDCDGATDEGDPEGGGACQTEGMEGACGAGTLHCEDGALECVPDGAGAPEECNGVDDDCDGETDEKGAAGCTTYYLDKDEDDYGVASAFECLCAPEGQYTAIEAGDCDDLEPAANPAAVEVCDGSDNDCDGLTDPPGIPGTEKFYTDDDGDGYSDGLVSAFLCAGTEAHPTQLTGDCDDDDPDVHPAAAEVCDGKDNDCNDTIDGPAADVACTTNCGFGAQVCAGGVLLPCDAPPENACIDFSDCSGYVTCESCPATPADDQCDGVDDDCDGAADDEAALTLLDGTEVSGPGQPCGAGICAGGTTVCADNALVCPSEDIATLETCNSEDDDCDGETDEGLLQPVWNDGDDDGFGDPDATQDVCIAPDGWVANSLDCDDTDPAVHPGAEEVCDAKDNDCNGVVDQVAEACDLGCEAGTRICLDGEWGDCDAPQPLSCMNFETCEYQVICVTECPAAPPELCNGADDNCNGAVDEELGETTCGQGPCEHSEPACVGGQPAVCDPFLGAVLESCDGVDNDCNGGIDDGDPGGGGYCLVQGLQGACAQGVLQCLEGQLQCVQTVWPQDETCNGVDDDCIGGIDDGLGEVSCGLGPCEHSEPACVGGQPTVCDPFLGATPEVCDGADNDCDGTPDDGDPGGGGACLVPGLQGECANGILHCQGGAPVCTQTIWPQAEVCNGKDDDCTNGPDDGDPGGGVSCQVPGKKGPCATGVQHCQNGAPVCTQTVWPQNETCNGEDDDCDGTPDDGNPGGGASCNIPWLSGPCATGQQQCQGGQLQCVQTVYPQSESCNGVDDNCDGQVDGQTQTCSNGCNSGTQTCNWGSWSSCNAAPPQCTSGACCDGCNYRSSSYKCNSSPNATQYQCTAWDNCGGQAQRRRQYQYCTGYSSSCGTSNLQWESWYTLYTCSSNQPCYASSSTAYCKSACTGASECTMGECETTCQDVTIDASQAALYNGSSPNYSTWSSCTDHWWEGGWHNGTGANGINIRWTWTGTCPIPSASNPTSYLGANARWSFSVGAAAYYDIRIKIPATGYVCDVGSQPAYNRYASDVWYGLKRSGATGQIAGPFDTSSYKGQWISAFNHVWLNAGSHTVILYDHGSTAAGSCPNNSDSSRFVFVDSVQVVCD